MAAVLWILATLAGCLVVVGSARAGEWMELSCRTPTGGAASAQGWSGGVVGSSYGLSASPACSDAAPLSAGLSNVTPEPVGSAATLTFTPPLGSVLIGGRLSLALTADGGGTDAAGSTLVQEPAPVSADTRLRCVQGQAACSSRGSDYTGTFTLPSDLGGTLTVSALCAGTPGFSCAAGGRGGFWASAQVSGAALLLSSTETPRASGISGSLLRRGAHGVSGLTLDAAESAGPGIYTVSAAIDGSVLATVHPSTNGGACVPQGLDTASGALMFAFAQPCPLLTPAALHVATAGLPDGKHQLTVTVADAAGDTATVLRRTILTFNPIQTPRPRRGPRARFTFSWRWGSAGTTLRYLVRAHDLPADARTVLTCTGTGCPRLPSAPLTVGGLRRALHERTLGVGDRLLLAVTEGHAAERIRLTVRAGRAPAEQVLAPTRVAPVRRHP